MQENGEKNSTKENSAPKTAWDELRSDADKWNSFSQGTQMMEPRQESAPLNEKPEFMPEVQKWLDGEMEDLADWMKKHEYSDEFIAQAKAELMAKATQKQAELSGEKAHAEEIQEEQDHIAMEFNPYAQIWGTQSRQEDSAKKEREERAKQEAEEYARQQEEERKRELEERAKRELEERAKREQEERAKREQEDLQRWNDFARHAQMSETRPSKEREELIAKKEAELREIDKKIADAEKELELARKGYRIRRKLGNLATTLFRFFKKN